MSAHAQYYMYTQYIVCYCIVCYVLMGLWLVGVCVCVYIVISIYLSLSSFIQSIQSIWLGSFPSRAPSLPVSEPLFFSLGPGVWRASLDLYPNKRALPAAEQRRVHRPVPGLLRPRPALRRVPLRPPPLPASTGLPLLRSASPDATSDCCKRV